MRCLKVKKSLLAHFKVFGTRCFVHINEKKNIDKFEPKSEPRIFLGYSETSRAYRIYNLKNNFVEESPHVILMKILINLCLTGMKIMKIS